jgi:hypothetical protein
LLLKKTGAILTYSIDLFFLCTFGNLINFKFVLQGTPVRPQVVKVGGSFNNWELVTMKASKSSHVIIIELPVGEHQVTVNIERERERKKMSLFVEICHALLT